MPRTFRQGARQPLSALDRTLNGHVAGLMPHEYSRHHSQRGKAIHGGGGWQKAVGGRTIGGVKNSLSQQRERSRKSRQSSASAPHACQESGAGGSSSSSSSSSSSNSNSGSKGVRILDEDETPRTARAESLRILPNLKGKAGNKGFGKGLKKAQQRGGDGPPRQRITAADVHKENRANREHGPSSVALEAARLRQSRTPVKGQDAPDWHDDDEGSKYDEHDESGVDLEADAALRDDEGVDEEERGARNAYRQRHHEGKVPGTPPAVSRAPVKTGKNARLQGGYHVATPTRMHFGPSETDTEGKRQDSSSAANNKERSRRRSSSGGSNMEQGPLTPAAAVRASQRNKAMRAKQLSDLGIEIDEGKYDEDSARMKVREKSSGGGSGSVSTPVRRPATSPLRSSGKRRSRRHVGSSNHEADDGSADRAPDTQRSPEPETARASQFVSERSPAAAMARLRRMKQERRTRSSSKQQRGSALKPKTPTQQKPKGDEVHHHHHHYFQQGPQGEYYEHHYDENGFDQYGYDQYGYDRYGYDKQGYDQQGYDQHGYNKQQNDEYHQQHHEHFESNHGTSGEGKHADEAKVGEGGGGGHADGDDSGADGITKRIRAGFDIVFSRARHGRFDEVRTALDSGMGVNTRDKHGNTLLHIACQNGNKRLLKMLLRSHAAIDASNKNGNTGLHFCFMYAYYGLGEYLISKGANDMIRNELGQTCYEADR